MSQFDPMTPCASNVAPDDEAYWSAVAAQYDVATDFINLENGFFGIPAQPVRDALQRYTERVNRLGTYFMRCEYPALQAQVLKELARFCGIGGCGRPVVYCAFLDVGIIYRLQPYKRFYLPTH